MTGWALRVRYSRSSTPLDERCPLSRSIEQPWPPKLSSRGAVAARRSDVANRRPGRVVGGAGGGGAGVSDLVGRVARLPIGGVVLVVERQVIVE